MFELIRFYPSLTLDIIADMTPQKTAYYIQAMNRIKAKERLELMDAIQYPHIKQKERAKSHRALNMQAYPENFENRTLKTTDLKLI